MVAQVACHFGTHQHVVFSGSDDFYGGAVICRGGYQVTYFVPIAFFKDELELLVLFGVFDNFIYGECIRFSQLQFGGSIGIPTEDGAESVQLCVVLYGFHYNDFFIFLTSGQQGEEEEDENEFIYYFLHDNLIICYVIK